MRATAHAYLDGYDGAAGPFEQVPAAHGAGAPGVPLAGESVASSTTSDRRGRRAGGWCAGVAEPRSLSSRGSGSCDGRGYHASPVPRLLGQVLARRRVCEGRVRDRLSQLY